MKFASQVAPVTGGARGLGRAYALRRFGQVEGCAGVLEFLVTDPSQYVTGQLISVCGCAVLTPN